MDSEILGANESCEALRIRHRNAIAIAAMYASLTKAKEKAWVIDQMIRALCGNDFNKIEAGFLGYGTKAYALFLETAKEFGDGTWTHGDPPKISQVISRREFGRKFEIAEANATAKAERAAGFVPKLVPRENPNA